MIRMGRLLPGAQPLGIGITGAHRGIVRIGTDEDVTAIVKPGPFGAIAAELFVAMLARDVALPVPEPILVFDPAGRSLMAGSIDMEYPNLCAAFPNLDAANDSDLDKLCTKIKDWQDHPLAAAFDEWIANVDRNIKNLLWDGNTFILIDHAMSLEQQPRGAPDVNKLVVALLRVVTDEVGRRRLLKQMTRNGLTFDELFVENAAKHLGGLNADMITAFSPRFEDFLKRRLPIIDQMFKARFPNGQQLLIQTS